MKHPIYTLLVFFASGYLALANMRGWNWFQSSANRNALNNTSYRYRSSYHSSGSGWSFGGSGFHK
jgi:hypothetical protein